MDRCSLLAAGPAVLPSGSLGERLTAMVRSGSADPPDPGRSATAIRWAAFAGWGRASLPLARLAEGHADALAILRELDGAPVPGASYGVWAARPGGRGARLDGSAGTRCLRGTIRYCSGAHLLDRALVVAETADGPRLVDVDLHAPGVEPAPAAWAAEGMRDSDTGDVVLHEVEVPDAALVGPPGAYTGRPGFWWGGAGVAAVWLGGAAGVLDALLPGPHDEHELAHLGTLHAELQAVDALLVRTAAAIDADPTHGHRTAVMTARAAAERACRTVLDRAPRVAGVAGITGQERLAHQLADLGVYVRQHHGEADLAVLGAAIAGRA